MSGLRDRLFGGGRDLPGASPRSSSSCGKTGLGALDKQVHLSDQFEGADWLLDQDAGTITFGGDGGRDGAGPGDAVGRRSERGSGRGPTRACRRRFSVTLSSCGSFGERHGIEVFTEAERRIDPSMSPEMPALVASELTDADGYYRCPHPRARPRAPSPPRRGPSARAPLNVRRVVRMFGLAGAHRRPRSGSVEVHRASAVFEVRGEPVEVTGRAIDGNRYGPFDPRGGISEVR